MANKRFTIRSVAQCSGVGIETIRYYQRIGLIEAPKKPLSGYRIYSEDILERLAFIQRAKGLGFSLAEISTLLALGDRRCPETKELAIQKLDLIQRKIGDLQAIAASLDERIQACESNSTQESCPMIRSIREK